MQFPRSTVWGVLLVLVLIGASSTLLHGKKKKKRPPSPEARARQAYPGAKQAYADARLALYRAQHQLSRVMREANKKLAKERDQLDRSGYAEALEEHRDAQKHVEQLIERTREKLGKTDKAYIQAKADLRAAQAHYEKVSNADEPDAQAILNALNAIKAPSQTVGRIEKAALDANAYFQKAVEREELAAERLEAERTALAAQLNSEEHDPLTKQALIDASADVSKARKELAEKTKVLARLQSILEPNNSITVGITKLNQNQKRKPKRKGKRK